MKRLIIIVCSLCIALSLQCNAQDTTKAHFLSVLKQTGPYNNKQVKDYPDFTYMSARDPHLTELRKKYKLDSVAGTGNDLSRIINLLHWMHKAVPHGDVMNLPILNADYIITSYREKNTVQGCYPLSVSLNEIYLSMGFKSRSVIWFAQNFKEAGGGHVIDAVYVNSLQKWVWMDPQNDAYLMDEKGTPLSIPEVRDRVIHGKKLALNKEADYHGDRVTLDDYIYTFMVKYLYRYQCPLNSEYDSQTVSPDKVRSYVELLPVDSGEPPAGSFESQSTKNYKVKTYHTNNEELFWQAPKADQIN